MNKLSLAGIGAVLLVSGILGYQYFTGRSALSDSEQGNVAQGGSGQGKSGQGASASGKGAANGRSGGGGGRPAPLVVASDVTQVLINDRLEAVGNGTARASVSVVPLSGGTLTEILVSSGQRVEANDILARQNVEEEQIARDRAARAAAEATSDAARLDQLFRSRTATEVELNRARAIQRDTELALRDAELKLARRTIRAPIAGVVGFVSVDAGNYINAQTELLTIDDRSSLVVEFWVPERFANQISLGQDLQAFALADPATVYTGKVNGIGSRIESDSRTLPVKASIENPDDKLRPGMSFELELSFPGQTYPAVNPLSIQWDSQGSYVWQIIDDKVKKVAAKVIQRNPKTVLIDAELTPEDRTVSEGLLSLRPGASVRVENPRPANANNTQSGEGDNLQAKPLTTEKTESTTGS